MNYTKITQLCDKTSQASSNPFAIFLKSYAEGNLQKLFYSGTRKAADLEQ